MSERWQRVGCEPAEGGSAGKHCAHAREAGQRRNKNRRTCSESADVGETVGRSCSRSTASNGRRLRPGGRPRMFAAAGESPDGPTDDVCPCVSGFVPGKFRPSRNRPGDSSRTSRGTEPVCEKLGRKLCGQPSGDYVRLDELRPRPPGTLVQDSNLTGVPHKFRRKFVPKDSRPGRSRECRCVAHPPALTGGVSRPQCL